MTDSGLFGGPATAVADPEPAGPPPAERRSRRPLLIVLGAVALVVVLAAGYFLLFSGSSSSSGPSGAVPLPSAPVTVHHKTVKVKVVAPTTQITTITGRDPFAPVVAVATVAPAAPSAAASAAPTTAPSASASASASGTGSGKTSGYPVTGSPTSFTVVGFGSVKTDPAATIAVTTVNGKKYSAALGQSFATYFRYVATSGPTCGVFLYGDATVNACVGQTVTLAG